MSIGHPCHSHIQLPQKTSLNPTHSTNPTPAPVAQVLKASTPTSGATITSGVSVVSSLPYTPFVYFRPNSLPVSFEGDHKGAHSPGLKPETYAISHEIFDSA